MVEERFLEDSNRVHAENKTEDATSSNNYNEKIEIGQEIVAPDTCAGSFGNIVVKNSSKVLFGNKTHHQYEGPVTVKQFVQGGESIVIQKDEEYTNSDDNHIVQNDDHENKKNKTNFSKGTNWLNKHRKPIIIVIVVLLLVKLTALILFLTMRNRKITDSSWRQDSNTNETLVILSRTAWLAELPKEKLDSLSHPVPYVIITHTVNPSCTNRGKCTDIIRFLQHYHMNDRGWSDIGYNFLIGGDGYVYEGRGWKYVGAHTKGWNTKSIGIAFVGTFEDIMPPHQQILAAQLLIEEGAKENYLAHDYKLFAHRQVSAKFARSPGEVFYENIKTWPHWSDFSTL